jgi:hypothetical protein
VPTITTAAELMTRTYRLCSELGTAAPTDLHSYAARWQSAGYALDYCFRVVEIAIRRRNEVNLVELDKHITGRADRVNGTTVPEPSKDNAAPAQRTGQASEAYQTTVLRLSLKSAGFSPVPLTGKIPALAEWQQKAGAAVEEISSWSKRFPYARNTGVLTRHTPAIDLDITDPGAASALEELARKRYAGSGTFIVRIGRAPKRAILLHTAEPFRKILVDLISPNARKNQKPDRIEVLADGQQLASFGIHPETNEPFSWFGGRPGEIRAEELPQLTADSARRFVDDAVRLLTEQFGYRVKSDKAAGNGRDRGNQGDPGDGAGDDGAATADGQRELLYQCRRVRDAECGDRHPTLISASAAVGRLVAAGQIPEALARRELTEAAAAMTAEGRGAEVKRTISDGLKFGKEHGSQPEPSLHTWEDPDWSLLDDRRGELPNFPSDALTPEWQTWLKRCSHGAGVTTPHVAIPLLGIASSLIGTAKRVRAARAWAEPMTTWTAIVGFSGTGKTPGLDVIIRPLARIEYDRRPKVAELRRDHDTLAEAAKAVHKKWKTEVQAAIEAGQKPPTMPANAVDPGSFVAPRLYVSDSTIERLASLLQARPRGILLIDDELAGLFLNMSRYSGGQDNEFWLKAWDGKPYVVERMSRNIAIDYLLVGITGGFQPDKLARSFSGDSDGMYARVLFAWPEEPRYRALSNDVGEIEPEIINAFTRLIDLPAECPDSVFAPKDVWLTDDAITAFEHFRCFRHSRMSGMDGREREWWAKANTHVLRLAGTLAYLDWAMRGGSEPEMIDAQFVHSAIRLVRDYFWPHARAALRQIGLSERHVNARRVLRWIAAHHRTEVSREDIRRDALGQKLDAEQTQALLDALVKAGWLRPLTGSPPGPSGGRPVRRWAVNPRLLSTAETAETAGTPPRPPVSAVSAVSAIENEGEATWMG